VTARPQRTVTAAATDVGRRRSHNEDRYAVWTPDDGMPGSETLLVVCDGMGGSNAGEVASRIAAETVVREFERGRGDDPLDALAEAVEEANREIYEHSCTRSDLQGMGTTTTAALLKGADVYVAHVGDSRAFLVRNGHARQITTDHSLVAQLVASKQLDPVAAQSDRRRNVVTRSVGVGPTVEVDRVRLEEPLRAGDTIVLCSDGLHGLVTNEEIGRVAGQHSLDASCRELVALANERGGPDNITVVMGRLEADSEEPVVRRSPRHAAAAARGKGSSQEQSRTSRRTMQLLIVALIGLVLTLGGIIWVVWGMSRASREGDTSTRGTGRNGSGEQLAWR
jgi:protein phosphatase